MLSNSSLFIFIRFYHGATHHHHQYSIRDTAFFICCFTIYQESKISSMLIKILSALDRTICYNRLMHDKV